MTIDDISNGTEFLNDQPKAPVLIKVVGVGGGGNNAINHMYRQGIKDVSFVNINTDRQALMASPVPTKLQIGPGLGAGNKPEVARDYAEQAAAEIDALFEDDAKMVFITAGMGGGTGTGAAPVVARIAKERGLLTIGIVTIPFLFEGEKKIIKALDGADEMSKYVDAMLVINNERLTEIYNDLDFLNAFAKADDTLLVAAQSISDLITSNGMINLDFNDVHTALHDSGTAIISSGIGEGEHRVTKAIEDALLSPLLRNSDILSSTRLLFNIYVSRQANQTFKMDEINEITQFVSKLYSDVDVIWGLGYDDTLGDAVRITVLAAGFEMTFRDKEAKPQQKQAIAQDVSRKINRPGNITDQRSRPERGGASEEQKSSDRSRIQDIYDSDKIADIKRNKNNSRYIILSPDQIDNEALIDAIERSPAFNRDRKAINNAVSPATSYQSDRQRRMDPNIIEFGEED